MALTGYKYVGMCVCAAAGLALGARVYYVVRGGKAAARPPGPIPTCAAAPLQALLYTGLAMAYFVVRSLTPQLRGAGAEQLAGGAGGAPPRRPVVLAAGALQLLFMWWIGLVLEV